MSSQEMIHTLLNDKCMTKIIYKLEGEKKLKHETVEEELVEQCYEVHFTAAKAFFFSFLKKYSTPHLSSRQAHVCFFFCLQLKLFISSHH